MTFIMSEDEALHTMLRGMTVSDQKNPERPVGVWFGQPDPELQAQAYPYVTIDLIDISEARERVMSGRSAPWYFADDLNIDEDEEEDWDIWNPTPINLDYQITTYARQPRHDRQILAQIMRQRLPLRFGSLLVKEKVEMDGEDTIIHATTRRLDVLGVVKRDLPEAGKRLFQNVFTIRVSSEVLGPFENPRQYVKVRALYLRTYRIETPQPVLDTVQVIGTP